MNGAILPFPRYMLWRVQGECREMSISDTPSPLQNVSTLYVKLRLVSGRERCASIWKNIRLVFKKITALCFKNRADYVSAVGTIKFGGTYSNHLRPWFSSCPIRLYDVVSESHIYCCPVTFFMFFWHFRNVCVVIGNGLYLFDGV